MVWKKSDGTIVNVGSSWVDSNKIRHPSNWNIWSADDKKAAGLTWADDLADYDQRFYWGYDSDNKLIEKKLADEDATDADGNKIKDVKGNQIVNEGLKTIWVRRTKQTTNDLLVKTDWYVVRKAEGGSDIPSSISTLRTNIRNACKTIEDKINGVSAHADFIKLFDEPVDSDGKVTGNAPIYDFPEET